jgi:hypothetical protein
MYITSIYLLPFSDGISLFRFTEVDRHFQISISSTLCRRCGGVIHQTVYKYWVVLHCLQNLMEIHTDEQSGYINIVTYYNWKLYNLYLLDAGFHREDPGWIPGELKLRFMVDKWHWSRFLSEFFGSPLLIIIPPLLYTGVSPPHEVCDSPDQAAQYHTTSFKLGASSLTEHSAAVGVKVVRISSVYLMYASVSRPALRPTQPPVQWVPVVLSGGKARLENHADHSPPSCAEVNNE